MYSTYVHKFACRAILSKTDTLLPTILTFIKIFLWKFTVLIWLNLFTSTFGANNLLHNFSLRKLILCFELIITKIIIIGFDTFKFNKLRISCMCNPLQNKKYIITIIIVTDKYVVKYVHIYEYPVIKLKERLSQIDLHIGVIHSQSLQLDICSTVFKYNT
jgi:hypothetical protein